MKLDNIAISFYVHDSLYKHTHSDVMLGTIGGQKVCLGLEDARVIRVGQHALRPGGA